MSYAVINSPTNLLPAWTQILVAKKKKFRKIPRDVSTRWNSTYVVLEFADEYQEAIDDLTATNKELRKFELSEEEWERECARV